jgi:glycosyltransferase involved in cell wall biosynthesis
MNNASGLERTLCSIAQQTFENFELIVIDGGSTDNTRQVIKKHAPLITQWTSESDRGIYDAMNKGIAKAKGEWLIFMNAGDRFSQSDSLKDAMSLAGDDVSAIYSDTTYENGRKLAVCSEQTMRIVHQSFVYRRDLHEKHGLYLNAPNVTISDYMFFVSISNHKWAKSPTIIADCELGGVSCSPKSYYQKLAVDLMTDRRSSLRTGMMLVIYPIYRLMIRPLVRIVFHGKI